MSRPLRILAAGALYHVMARGNAKMAIYCDDVDRQRFLTVLDAAVGQFRIECHAYCLMSNHYHLVIGTPEPNLSSALQYLNGVYAQWWNKRHQRVGHVLAARFKAQLIQEDRYFLEACRYVVLNAVRAGFVRDLVERADSTEVTRRDRSLGRPTLENLFHGIRDKRERNLRIREARGRFCYRLSEIAAHVSLHYGSVSRIVSAAGTPPTTVRCSAHAREEL